MKKVFNCIFAFVLILFVGMPLGTASVPFAQETQSKDKIIYETSNGIISSSTILSKEEFALKNNTGFNVNVCFDYSYPEENMPQIKMNASKEKADTALARHRVNVKKFYTEKNKQLIRKYDLPDDVFISQYTTFIVFEVYLRGAKKSGTDRIGLTYYLTF